MSNYTDKFFADKAVGALWDVAVSIKRGNPLPLDKDSVVHGLTELNAIATGSVSYPGQIIAVVEDAVYEGEELVTEESVTLYYLDHNKTPKEVGKVPTGDGKTIEVSSEGTISLLGSASAQDGTLPMFKDGALVWKTLEDIGAGDGNDNTTYEFSFADEKITIKPLFNGQPIKAEEGENADDEGNLIVELDLSAFLTNSDLEPYAKTADVNEALALKAAKAVVDAMYTNEQIDELIQGAKDYADNNDANDNTTYAISYESKVEGEGGHPARIVLTPSEGEATYVDATPFIKDGMLDNVAYNAESNTLTFTFNTDAGKEDVIVELTDILAPYTGKDGERIKVEVNGNEISADLKAGTIAKTYLDTNVQASLALADSALQEHQDISNLATKAEVATAKSEAISAAAADATSKADAAKADAIADANAKLANKANSADVYAKTETYSQDEIDDLLEGIQAGSSESAASVKTQLDAYKKVVNAEVWGNEEGTGNSRIDTLETGVASAIKDVKAAANAKITVDTTGKVATIDDAALQTLIAEAKKAGTDANSALETYKVNNNAAVDKVRTDLATEAGKLATLTETVNGHTTSITDHGTRIGTLESTVAGHTATITELSGTVAQKANQTALDAAVARIATNESAITTLNETTTDINEALEDKAPLAGYEDLASKVDGMGTAATALEGRVKANEDAIAAIPATFVDNDELAAAIKVETDRAGAEEKRLAGLIAGNTATINSILGNKDETDLNSIAELAAWINEHGTEASGMAEAIETNTEAIAALTQTVSNNKTATDEAITAITDNYKVKDVDGTTLQVSDAGVASIKEVSTDLLAQGTEELIFSAGNAGIKTKVTE